MPIRSTRRNVALSSRTYDDYGDGGVERAMFLRKRASSIYGWVNSRSGNSMQPRRDERREL